MKLVIVKSGNNIEVQVTYQPSKKPLLINLTQSQLEGFIKTVEILRNIDNASMTLEM